MLTIPIVKVDEARRLVYGRATDETPDAQGEAMDYDSSKPHFLAWSQEQADATGGRSKGNLRSMHSNTASGLITELEMDDRDKAVNIVARVVDDNEWKKVLDGVYCGFSLGGKYLRRWPDIVDGEVVIRYTARPTEISLVDRPANYNAVFYQVLKRDGTVRRVEFQHQSEVEYMFTPRDDNYCGRSTAANLIKAAMSAPAGDLTEAFGKSMHRPDQRLQQGISESLRKQLASAGMAVRGPTTVARNGATESSVDAIRQIHSGGARKMSPVSLPPQSDNAARAPTRIHPHITAPQGDQYRTPSYTAPPLVSGTSPQSASESAAVLPAGNRDQYDPTVAAIRGIHREGPQRGYLR